MDFADFNALHMPALEKNEAKHTLILSIMEKAAVEEPAGQTRNWSFSAAGACAVQSPTRGLVLGEMSEADCRALADREAGGFFRSVVGPDETPHWFVDHARTLGARFAEPMPQRIHALSDAPIYPGAPGTARPVTLEDADLFAEWFTAFEREASPEDNVPTREQMDRKAASGDCLFWMNDGQPVAMAGIVRRTRRAAAIALVYTPPELRGRGYAGSATAAVVEKAFAEGRRTTCLYTDLTNPASNRCYAKIGFKPICDSWFFQQERPEAGE